MRVHRLRLHSVASFDEWPADLLADRPAIERCDLPTLHSVRM